jgi:hypothetical protein
MHQGSVNEDFIIQRLLLQPWVSGVFDVGLLQSKHGAPWIAVSLDAIIIANIPDVDCEQVVFVEMKTRQSTRTIAKAREATNAHGDLVYCKYDDDIFCECVPNINRKQLLHQAAVTGLKYGLFITSIAFDNQSVVIQYVLVEFSQEVLDSHYVIVETVGQALIGWL